MDLRSGLTWNQFRSEYARLNPGSSTQQVSKAYQEYKADTLPIAKTLRASRGPSPRAGARGRSPPPSSKESAFAALPAEARQEILLNVPYKDLRRICATSRRIEDFCQSEEFLAAYSKKWGVSEVPGQSSQSALKRHYTNPLREFQILSAVPKRDPDIVAFANLIVTREAGQRIREILGAPVERRPKQSIWWLKNPRYPDIVWAVNLSPSGVEEYSVISAYGSNNRKSAAATGTNELVQALSRIPGVLEGS